jgi:hypothetical protein
VFGAGAVWEYIIDSREHLNYPDQKKEAINYTNQNV